MSALQLAREICEQSRVPHGSVQRALDRASAEDLRKWWDAAIGIESSELCFADRTMATAIRHEIEREGFSRWRHLVRIDL